jgi:hypothetical protein
VGEQEQFSVQVHYDNGECHTVRRFVSAKEASRAFAYYTSSLGAQLGVTTRVIIIDSSDCMVREWKLEQGVTFPPARGRRKTGGKKSRRSDDARS